MRKIMGTVAILLFICFLVQSNFLKYADAKPYSEHSTAAKTGLVTGSVFSSAVYVPFKLAYAVLGGITSGLTYGVTLGKEAEAANNIAVSSFYGDWYIHPDILTGEETLYFSGPKNTSR
ncbi:MAG: hypothetical protein MRK02_02565 [Candidatus Scalindua sp.]|nr:hypothetical protein [Candidatus Scalindua sp.]